ncbi:MAG: FtsQ-type POTRA domain-containing protein [Alphaproteobacteria bacterium]|nr:FtsQ-type POTRA domain-containing protein [Alphaproteobacteria bacterium]
MAVKRKNTKTMRSKGDGLKSKAVKKKPDKPKGARKSTMTQKRKNANKSEAFLATFKKISVIILIFLLFLWGVGWYILSDGPARTSLWLRQQAISLSADYGFTVRNILVEGRRYTDSDALLAIINVRKGDPIFTFVPSEAKRQIERIGWVKSVHIQRRLPDTIYIMLEERHPTALWLNDDVLSLIDDQGIVITQSGVENFKTLMMVQGVKAPGNTKALLSMLVAQPDLKKQIDHAVFVDGRRWNLILSGDLRVKLPEHNAERALVHIMNRHAQNQILDNNTIVEIDARYKDRLIVRTSLGRVQDYKAGIR